MDEDNTVRVTAMLGVLTDKAEKQKKKIAKLLSKPKAERNVKHLKTILHEARSIRKLLKKVKKEFLTVICPVCNTSFNIEIPKE